MNNQLPLAIEAKDLVGMILLVTGAVLSTAFLLLWPRLREAVVFLLVGGTAATTLVDLNIYSAYWYRGTTRGFEFTAFDPLALGLLVACLLSPRLGRPRWFWPASLAPLGLFIGYCLLTTVWAEPAIFGLFEISKLLRGLVYFAAIGLYLRQTRNLVPVILGLAGSVCVEGLMAMRARFLLGEYRPGGTLTHANSLSMYLCLVAPVLIAAACSEMNLRLRQLCWIAVGLAAIGVVLTLSRAGLPIFLLVSLATLAWCGSWRPSPRTLLVGLAALVGLTGLLIKSYPLLAERYGQSTLEDEYLHAEGESRGYYFRQAAIILRDRPLGVGLNNWSYWVSKEYGKALGMPYEDYDNIVYAPPSDLLYIYRFAPPAHNLAVLTTAELGWAGLALLLIVWARWLQVGCRFLFSRNPEPLQRVGIGIFFGIGGVFLQSLTEWTFRQTQIFLTFSVLVGAMAAMHALRQRNEATAAEEETEDVEDWTRDPLPVPASASAVGSN
jgi:hypothetical protein